jgi:hypothetical protein
LPKGTGQNFNVANLNARNGDPSGTHLRFNNPIGGELLFSIPTTGYNDAVVKFSTRRSGSGAGLQYWSYTLNGTDFIAFDTLTVLDADPVLHTFDFSETPGTDNNANFKIKVSFAQGAGGTVGNNRFDNFTVDAAPINGPPTEVPGPTSLLGPANNATSVPVLPSFSWSAAERATTYRLDVATDAAFTNTVVSQILSATNYTLVRPPRIRDPVSLEGTAGEWTG